MGAAGSRAPGRSAGKVSWGPGKAQQEDAARSGHSSQRHASLSLNPALAATPCPAHVVEHLPGEGWRAAEPTPPWVAEPPARPETHASATTLLSGKRKLRGRDSVLSKDPIGPRLSWAGNPEAPAHHCAHQRAKSSLLNEQSLAQIRYSITTF